MRVHWNVVFLAVSLVPCVLRDSVQLQTNRLLVTEDVKKHITLICIVYNVYVLCVSELLFNKF